VQRNKFNTMYFLYILQCKDSSLYTGITKDLEKRLKKHNNGKGSKYVRSRVPFKLVYTEEFSNKMEAMKREWKVKQLSKLEKEKLILKSRKPIIINTNFPG